MTRIIRRGIRSRPRYRRQNNTLNLLSWPRRTRTNSKISSSTTTAKRACRPSRTRRIRWCIPYCSHSSLIPWSAFAGKRCKRRIKVAPKKTKRKIKKRRAGRTRPTMTRRTMQMTRRKTRTKKWPVNRKTQWRSNYLAAPQTQPLIKRTHLFKRLIIRMKKQNRKK